jgi:outer membrane receptor protein involved in Fe transport
MLNLKTVSGYVLLVLAFSAVSLAQSGSLAGTVTDTSGAVVQGADVIARNVGSNTVRSTTSDAAGSYSMTDLAAGVYEVTVKKESFKLFHEASVELSVAQTLTVNVKLEPGATTEEVQVQANQTAIETDTAQLSNLVDQRQMQSLPLITRNPYQLVLLSPGTSQTDSGNAGISVNGARDRNNNFMLDGVDNNDTSVPGGMGGVLSANPDSTEEFRVITDNFNAEYGRNTGAIIDVITKSGTNSFHGGAYYFGRWNGFGGARDFFNPGVGPNAGPENPYIRHQFGFSVGGAIYKNKTFFFFNDEMDRFRTSLTGEATVPTAAFLSGQFNYTYTDSVSGASTTVPIDLLDTPGNGPGGGGNNGSTLLPVGSNAGSPLPFDPTMQKVFAFYPTVAASQSSNGISGNVFFPTTSATSSYSPVVKIDHHFTDRESLSLRYGYNHSFDPDPFHSDILPGGLGAIASKSITEGLAAQLTSTLSNNLVNNLQFGWNHIYATFYLGKDTLNALDSVAPVDSLGNGWDFAMNPFTSFASTLSGADSQARKTGTISYTDSISWVHGQHTFKFGGDFRDVGESGFDDFTSRRQLTLDPETAFGGFDPGFFCTTPTQCGGIVANEPANDLDRSLVDAATAYYGSVIEDSNSQFFNKTGTRQLSDNKNFKQHEFDFFAQDTWKVRPNFTLNIGLRYQYNSVPYETDGNLSNLLQDPSTYLAGQPVTFSTVGSGSPHGLYDPDYKDIEPRFGFSWDPWSNGKTSIRGGFGMFHDRTFGNAFGNARSDPPFQASYNAFPGPGSFNGETFGNAFGSGTFAPEPITQTPSPSIQDGALATAVIFNTHFPNAGSNNWDLDVQRELPGNNVIDIAYVGAMGVHVWGQRDGNPPDPNLVQQLLAYCVPGNAFGCDQTTVSGSLLYEGFDFGALPFNAVNNNALFQPDYQIDEFNSIYHSMQSKFTHRMSHGLQVQAAYTWSHALDNSVDPLTPAVGNRTFPRNSRNLAQSYGNSDNDTRNVAVINYIWEMPFGRGKSYLSHGVMGKIMEGFELDGIFTAQTGHPFNIRGTLDTQRTGIGAWGYQVGNPYGAPAGSGCSADNFGPGSAYNYFSNLCAFTNPPWGSASNNERNQFYGPGFWDWDITLAKRMTITEKVKAELRFEGYNILNHPHFLNPGTDGAALGNLIGQGQFGQINATYTQPDGTTSARQIQVALKINF